MPMLDADADALLLPLSRCSRGWPLRQLGSHQVQCTPALAVVQVRRPQWWVQLGQPAASRRSKESPATVSSVIGITGPAPKKDVVWSIFIHYPLLCPSGYALREKRTTSLVSSTTKGYGHSRAPSAAVIGSCCFVAPVPGNKSVPAQELKKIFYCSMHQVAQCLHTSPQQQ
jgi:hypothetical protein